LSSLPVSLVLSLPFHCRYGSSTMSSPLIHTTLPPYEQLLVAEGCGAAGVGVGSICRCRRGLGKVVVGVVSMTWGVSRVWVCTLWIPRFTGLPASPCVPPVWRPILVDIPSSTLRAGACSHGDGCGGRLGIRCFTHNPPHEQLLMGMGQVLGCCHCHGIKMVVVGASSA
jgi:hypothetical protein